MTRLLAVKLTPVLAGCLILGGCQTLPVVPHAINCDVNAELLAGKCAAPKPVPDTTTYATLVDTMQADRKSLRECSIEADTLRETIRRCNQATVEYNRKIDALNSRK
jgi:hypothetical protein